MDRVALRLANLLAGNDESDAAFEAALVGPAITFDEETVIAVTGADLRPSIDDTPVSLWRPIWVRAGATLRFAAPGAGCRTYVAVAGGLDVPPVFGSRSTYLRAGFGGHEGRPLKSADVLFTCPRSVAADQLVTSLRSVGRSSSAARWSVAMTLRPPYADDVVVRVTGGAHLGALTEASRETLFTETFRVSSSSDRMGYRLEAQTLSLREPLELLSEGVTFGTVQLPPGGAPIILMADAQTTGGYPRIAEVASVDLPLIAQLKPGDRLRFRPVSLGEAQALYLARELDIAQARVGLALRLSRGPA
jgi:antagonist of KipI